MKKYVKNADASSGKCSVTTPYGSYEFDGEEEMQEFLDYIHSDPDYDDSELGDVIEHCFFLNKEYGE